MEYILLLLPFNCLFVLGMYLAMKFEGSDDFDAHPRQFKQIHGKPQGIGKEILWWVRWYAVDLPWYIRKPLYYCPTCMASLWSIPVFWYFMPFTVESVIIHLLYIPALAAINTIIAKHFDL